MKNYVLTLGVSRLKLLRWYDWKLNLEILTPETDVFFHLSFIYFLPLQSGCPVAQWAEQASYMQRSLLQANSLSPPFTHRATYLIKAEKVNYDMPPNLNKVTGDDHCCSGQTTVSMQHRPAFKWPHTWKPQHSIGGFISLQFTVCTLCHQLGQQGINV